MFTYAASEAYGVSPTITVVNSDLTATNELIYGGATNLLEVWQLPETTALRSQALDKLAPVVASLLTGTNDSDLVQLARPLLEDLLQSESSLELIDRTNLPPAWTLAIKLDSTRGALWLDNVGRIAEKRKASGRSPLSVAVTTNSWVLLGCEIGRAHV